MILMQGGKMGMPQAVDAYLETNNMSMVDRVKRNILELYEEDFRKIDPSGRAGMLVDAIPAELNKNSSRYQVSSVIAGGERKIASGEIFCGYAGFDDGVYLLPCGLSKCRNGSSQRSPQV